MRKRFFIAFYIAAMLGLSANAQQALTPSGGDDSGPGGTSHFTIGQLVFQEQSSLDGFLNEGVQHHYTISIPTKLNDQEDIKLTTSIFPNPTTNTLTLKIEREVFHGMRYVLYDLSGNILSDEAITSTTTFINMSAYSPATYIVKIASAKKELKTFTITKK